jgi:hypothetical protein
VRYFVGDGLLVEEGPLVDCALGEGGFSYLQFAEVSAAVALSAHTLSRLVLLEHSRFSNWLAVLLGLLRLDAAADHSGVGLPEGHAVDSGAQFGGELRPDA